MSSIILIVVVIVMPSIAVLANVVYLLEKKGGVNYSPRSYYQH